MLSLVKNAVTLQRVCFGHLNAKLKLNSVNLLSTNQKAAHLSTTGIRNSVWEEDWAAPVPDREFYRQHPPEEGDALYRTNVRAAPTRHFYSYFYDPVLQKFEKMILKKGQGYTAYQILSNTLRKIKLTQVTKYHRASEEEKLDIETDPVVIFHQAIQNATPAMSLKRTVKGGSAFQVPVPISDDKKFFLTSSWILKHCRQRRQRTPISDRLAKEILAAYNNEGVAVKKKQDLHRQILANRAYVHLRWK
uniref:28S ribosomal protein S7, mitochondrial-like n=1 Tax=Styela clava TaxID=7725 RepID=UPI00193A6409|nr:28S ribosomal protein S7, mitochondrial-like [Styela clava]